MDPLLRLIAKNDISELKAMYCRCLDTNNWDGLEELFTENAELVTTGSTAKGPRAIRETAQSAMDGIPTSHQAFLPEINLCDGETAEGTWAMMFMQSEGRTTGAGHYFDRYQKVDGRWLFSRIEVATTFVEGSAISDLMVPSSADDGHA